MTHYFLWGIGDHQVSRRAATFLRATGSVGQPSTKQRYMTPPPPGGGGKWPGGLKGERVGGSVPALEPPPPPPESLSKSLSVCLSFPRLLGEDSSRTAMRQRSTIIKGPNLKLSLPLPTSNKSSSLRSADPSDGAPGLSSEHWLM